MRRFNNVIEAPQLRMYLTRLTCYKMMYLTTLIVLFIIKLTKESLFYTLSLFPRISLLKGRTMLVISWIRAPFLFSRKPLIKMLGKLNSCLRRKSKINIDNDNRTASRRGTQKRRSIWSDFQSEVQEGLRSVQTMTVKAEMKSREPLVRLT